MGVEVSPVFDKELPDAEFDGDGKTLAACSDVLDKIAKDNGVDPVLSSFFLDPEAEAEDLPEGQVIEETWYDPKDGLRTVAGLINVLEAPDGRARKSVEGGGALTPLWRMLGVKSGLDGKWAETVLADLKELERCLRVAIEHKARFFLLLG